MSKHGVAQAPWRTVVTELQTSGVNDHFRHLDLAQRQSGSKRDGGGESDMYISVVKATSFFHIRRVSTSPTFFSIP